MDNKLIIGIAVFVVLFIFYYIKITIDEKKGENSIEKQKLAQIAKELIPDIESYCAVYATREDFSISGSASFTTTTTKYWYYIAAINANSLYLIPLTFDDDQIGYDEPMFFNKDNLGRAKAKNHGFLTLYDKDKKEIFGFDVNPSNTKDDKYHPVNIQQKEETKAFIEISKEFELNINNVNGITDK